MPTVAGFLLFIRDVMGITATYLPNNAPIITTAFNVAVAIVNPAINQIDQGIYNLAVYNLAGDNLLNYATDQPAHTYFKDIRAGWNLTGFTPGVIASSADESTSESLLNPEFMKGLTLGNLQNLKTPYGRQYLAIAQDYGSLWGIS